MEKQNEVRSVRAVKKVDQAIRRWAIKPKTPPKKNWGVTHAFMNGGYPQYIYMHRTEPVSAISALWYEARFEKPIFHVSFAMQSARSPLVLPASYIPDCLREFDMEGAEEDNHVVDGVVRNFFLYVQDSLQGIKCECEKDAKRIITGDYEVRALDDSAKMK